MIFFKYHGVGNDFVLIDNLNQSVAEEDKSPLSIRLCDRRFGIGGDGLLLVESSSNADAMMRIFNPDGSEASMCGNGIRCFAKYLYDHGIAKKEMLKIETKSGVKEAFLTVENGVVTYVKVDMGKPLFESGDIPARGSGRLINHKIEVDGRDVVVTGVNTGVPHLVIFSDDVEGEDVKKIGRALRYNEMFPKGTNVNFVEKRGENQFKIRTYEKGVEDETLACGTGITASGAVAVYLNMARSDSAIEFQARGGTVYIEIEKKEEEISKALMNGPTEFVFEGKTQLF
ncbi:MAG: diaminopimelate epimerase [Candidatus Hydrothermarchaeales archaeon]